MTQILNEFLNISSLKRLLAVVLFLWVLMLLSVLVDLWTGIEKAKARNEFVDSGGFRRTFTKIGEYWRVLVMLLFIDFIGNIFPWYHFPFASVLGTVAVVAIEFRSVIENLRAKHSAAANIPTMIQKIIKCNDVRHATELLADLQRTQKTAESNKHTIDTYTHTTTTNTSETYDFSKKHKS